MGKKSSIKKRVNVFKGESNPFNVKVNREKHCILGQKLKGTVGLPIISHGQSHAKRRALWQKTKVKFHKANSFVDKRLMDGSMPSDEFLDSIVKDKKRISKRNIFNLNDDEKLTHLGQSLQDVKNFDDKGNASEDDEPSKDGFVKKVHFGDFNTEHKEQPKSHKEIMNQIIMDSKIRKNEMKLERDLTIDLTEKLDKDWKDMLSIMSGIKTGHSADVPAKNDPYDVIAKELLYEKKATPAKQLKSKEMLEKEEEERLNQLEEERRLRMTDESESKPRKASAHLSADSLWDDFNFECVDINAEASVEAPALQSESEYSDSDDESVDSHASEQLNEPEDAANINDEPCQNDESDECEINTSGIPRTMEEFEDLISSCANDPDEVSGIIEEILKDKLKTQSKKRLSRFDVFFGILMEYALHSLESNVEMTEIIPAHLHSLAEASPLNTSLKFLSYLDQEQIEFKSQKKQSNFPGLKTLLILKYSSVLYSVSDFRHPVVTPSMIFMCDILSSACFMTFHNIASRLFVCSIVLYCVSQSKSFAPEAVYFLHKVLKLAVPDNKNAKKIKKKEINLLLIAPLSIMTEEITLLDLGNKTVNDSIKVSVISQVVHQLQQFSLLYVDIPSYLELFSPVLSTCSKLPVDSYPSDLQVSIQNLMNSFESKSSPLCYLVYENTKPKPLKLFEPSFDSQFSKKDDIKDKLKMLKSVSQKIRKEEKGLIREMRKDVRMISAEKLKETMASDAERKRKVKELYHDLAVQEGEFKKMMKKKS